MKIITTKIPTDVKEIMSNLDFLGFNTMAEALSNVLEYDDYATRWDFTGLGEDIKILDEWKLKVKEEQKPKYFYKTNGIFVEQIQMPANTYALMGVAGENSRGLLTVRGIEGLVPLLNEKGEQYRIEEMAGHTFNGKHWYIE